MDDGHIDVEAENAVPNDEPPPVQAHATTLQPGEASTAEAQVIIEQLNLISAKSDKISTNNESVLK